MLDSSTSILVIDDNEAERYYLSRILGKAGFRVLQAATGLDGLRLAEAELPDLITLDIRLPDLNGYEVCRRLKSHPATRDIQVLHISASFTTPDAKAEGLDSGSDGYLTHPVDANELLATLRALLRARQAESRVRAAAREWTATFDLISDPVCLTGPDDRIVRCNAAFAQLLGRPFPAVIGQPLGELLPELGRNPSVLGVAPSEIRRGDRHFRVSVAAEGNGHGVATRAWVLGDITERERHEEARRRSEEEALARLQEIEAVYRSAPVGLCVLDTELRYVRANQRFAQMIGVPVDQLIGRRVGDSTPGIGERVEPRLREVLATGQPVHGVELRGVTEAQPGVERIWLATWMPIRGTDGGVSGINVAVEEVTEQRRLQEKLTETHRLEAVGQLAGGVAHEANNQMTVVLGCAGFVLRHPTLPDPVRADVEQIRQAAERTARITAQLLAFGRRQHLHPEIVDLDAAIDRLRPFLERALGDRCTLVVQSGSLGQRIRADVGQLEQMLLNLTLNSRDAMPDGGTLTVRTLPVTVVAGMATPFEGEDVKPGRYISLALSDTGGGMSAETLKRAFEPFFTTKGPGKGTGLGLSMVHGLVKQSGGYIRADSEPGQGTRIEIYLPKAEETDQLPLPPGSAGQMVASGQVLVVEDDPLVRAVLVRELAMQGYRVAEAPDGQSALDRIIATEEPFDLLITDLAMPRMDGRELATRVAAVRPDLPVLFMSGHPDETTRRVLADIEQPYLQKPFTAEELLSRAAEMLRRVR
jgi:two-component system, cell cycle sensor histidine kinase and response regulator CckA